MKQWLLLLSPLLIVLIVALSFVQVPKDPNLILDGSVSMMGSYDSYLVESEVIIDMGLYGSAIAYLSNITNAVLNGMEYSRIITQAPFSSGMVINQNFVLPEGNYSCTNSLLRPVCVKENESLGFIGDLPEGNFTSIEYLGSKRVNNNLCDAIYTNINLSNIEGLYGDYVSDSQLSSINDAFFYSCIDNT